MLDQGEAMRPPWDSALAVIVVAAVLLLLLRLFHVV